MKIHSQQTMFLSISKSSSCGIFSWYLICNPGKCKVMYSERTLAADTRTHLFGGNVIAEVQSLKYLGYWIGRAGRAENDKHIIAQATQLRFKIRAVLPILGEMLTLVLLESHETPMYCLEQN